MIKKVNNETLEKYFSQTPSLWIVSFDHGCIHDILEKVTQDPDNSDVINEKSIYKISLKIPCFL